MLFSKSRNNSSSKVVGNPDSSNELIASQASSGRKGNGNMNKSAPSIISSDLSIVGNLSTTGDVQIEGTVEGDIYSKFLTVGQMATVRGEIVANDIVIHGRVIGKVRGVKVRLSSTSRVEGDIIHFDIAIESGADFQGLVQRSDDPIGGMVFEDKNSCSESVNDIDVPELLQVGKC